jgi:hypothetical protein
MTKLTNEGLAAGRRRPGGRRTPSKILGKSRAGVVALVACLAGPAYFSARSCTPAIASVRDMQDQAGLAGILSAAGDYCERLKNMALFFVCRESIREKTFEFGKTLVFKMSPDKPRRLLTLDDLKTARTVRSSFLYDYQMIKSGGRFDEKRDLLEKNGKKKNERNVGLETLRMTAKYLVFGPVGFLSKAWQAHFHYEILGPDLLENKRAVVIRAEPREITEENYCFGRIWIDPSDSSILQIEWEPRSIANLKETVDSQVGELKRRIAWTVRYDVVKNGIRFPGSQSIREVYITKNGKEHVKYEAEYVYDRYKFFTVETEIVFK